MKRLLISSVVMMLISLSSFATDKSKQYNYFQRGAFFSVDLSAGRLSMSMSIHPMELI